ncbi:MAG: hypothetical protein JWM64_2805 [Frankiales bacterium]|nr:hypothetical protein [Frankiales bacterium]
MATELTRRRRTLRDRLREAGAVPHARLDAAFTADLHSAPGYARLLQALESFHSSADPLLASWVAGSPAAPAVTVVRRTAALRSDLLRLGVDPRPPVDLSGLPRDRAIGLLTDGAGLALLYVTAGSSIGARVVLRQLPETVPADVRTGLTEGAGPVCARAWRTTLLALDVEPSPAVTADATDGCELVFQALCVAAGAVACAVAP